MPTTTITWQDLTNAVINGDGDLEKTAGADNCFPNADGTGDAGARSVQSISGGDFEFRCSLGETDDSGEAGRSFVGLANGSFSLDFADWQFALHVSTEINTSGTPHPARSIFAYQGPAPNKQYADGIWTPGTLLRFVYRNGVMRAYVNSLLFYTYSGSPVFPLYAVASLACMNKTVLDPVFITGAGAGNSPCVIGAEEETEPCAIPWTVPTPAAFPTTPDPLLFQEIEPDWGEFSNTFGDGLTHSGTIQTAQVRRFLVEWDGLSEAEATALDAHWNSTRGGLKFNCAHPYTAETLNGMRYESYSKPQPHRKKWSQQRAATLVLFVN